MTNLFWTFTIFSILCIMVLSVVFSYRERFMFWPISKSFDITGGDWVEIDSNISGYHIRNPSGTDSPLETLILYSHGNGGNLTWYSHTMYLLTYFGDVLMYDYSGYGRSKGTCTEKEVLNSGLAAYDYAANLGYKHITCYGFSMGGSVSINIASLRNPDGLVLQSTFSRISDCIPTFVQFTIRDFFQSIKNVNAIKCPVVVLHSLKDNVVPYKSSKELYDSILTRKKFIDIEGGHNPAILTEEICSEVFDFLKHKEE